MLDFQDNDPQINTQEHRANKDSYIWPTFNKDGIETESIEVQLELKKGGLRIKP